MKYQLIILGPRKKIYVDTFKAELFSSLIELGLDEQQYFEILDIAQEHQVDWYGTIVAIWFGGKEQFDTQEESLLHSCIQQNIPIFPVVEDLCNYQDLVPTELHRVNGIEWNSTKLAADVLRAFKLSRQQRQAFISYRRIETRAVAVQLFASLSLHGYRTFLDTASVESGADFQEALWGRMADVDLLIFLDSPNALSSRWVYEELNKAHALGLGILQLIWPDHKRTQGTEFSDFIQLDKSHFLDERADFNDCLTDAAVNMILDNAERTRIRTLCTRRTSIIQELVDQAKFVNNLDAMVNPTGEISLYRDTATVGTVIPIIGIPDANIIQQREEEFSQREEHIGELLSKTRIIYNGLGIDSEHAQHLEWLNRRLSMLTCQIDLLDTWLETL